jgi:NAD(P)-dependent dehydrogenase (short-subunit alcohol dehydrogenase family)
MFENDLLKGKRILITGGGTGIGKNIGRRYLELDAELIICGRRLEKLQETKEEFERDTGGKVTVHQCDVRDPEAIEAMMSNIWSDGPLDILVNNAAGNFIAPTQKLSHRAIDAILGIVLHGAAYCAVSCGSRWIEAKHKGVILSILTTSALYGAPFQVPSAMAKAGVASMTRSLGVEWGPKGIRTVAIAPGPFPTLGAGSRLHPDDLDKFPKENDIPLRRVGDHSELANLAAYLVCDQAEFINGEVVVIDGGKSLQGIYGSAVKDMQEWDDAQWAAIRGKTQGQ